MKKLLLLAALLAPTAWGQFVVGGTMVHGGTGAPLPKVRLFLNPASNHGEGEARSTVSGPDGRFRFEGVAAGKYSLTAERLGFSAQGLAQRSLASGYSTAVVVGEGQPTEFLAFRMIPGAAITGHVRDALGEPVPRLTVRAMRIVGVGAARRAQGAWLGATDDRGYFRVASLPAGAYALAVSPASRSGGGPFDTEDAGYPVTYYPGVTNPEEAGIVRVQAGQEERADLAVRAVPLGNLTARVSGAAAGQSLLANLVARGPFGYLFNVGGSAGVYNGRLSFSSVPSGRYELGLWQAPNTLLGWQLVNITAQSGEIMLSVTTPAKVSASVQVRGPVRPSNYSLMVSLVQADGEWRDSAVVDANGRAEFRPTPPGRYEIAVSKGSTLAVASVAAKGAPVVGGLVQIPETGAVELTIVAEGSASDLPGQIFRAGRPEAAALAMLVPRDALANVTAYRFDQSDSDGTFTWQGVAKGEYLMFALEEGEPADYVDPEVVKTLLPKAQPLTVTGPAKQKVRLELPPR
jgi:hypothetical protein